MMNSNVKRLQKRRVYPGSGFEKKTACRVFVVFALLPALLLSLFSGVLGPELFAKETTKPVSVIAYEWNAVTDLSSISENSVSRMLLVWGNEAYISGKDLDGAWKGRKQFCSDSRMDAGELRFVTDNGRGTPYFQGAEEADSEYPDAVAGSLFFGLTKLSEDGSNQERNSGSCLLYDEEEDKLTAEKEEMLDDEDGGKSLADSDKRYLTDEGTDWIFLPDGTDSIGRLNFHIFKKTGDGIVALSGDMQGIRKQKVDSR